MVRVVVRCLRAALVGTYLLANVFTGAVAQEAQSPKYTDDKFDFAITVSPPWKTAKLQNFTVPGVARTAYSGQAGASIVIFMQEPEKDYTPRFLVDESVKGIEQGLGATATVKEVRSVAGKQAMWMVIQGKGTGAAIDGTGEVPTTQHWVAIPREKDILVVLLTCPTAAYEQRVKSFEESLKTMVVGGKQSAAQRESK